MKTRFLPLLLCLALLCALLAGCGGAVEQNAEGTAETASTPAGQSGQSGQSAPAGQSQAQTEDVEWDEDPAEVTWLMWNVGGTVNEEGVQNVEDALNEITLKKINVQVDLQILDMGTYMSQMPMQVSAGDKIDLITTFPAASGSYLSMVNAGQLKPLRQLLETYAPELLKVVPEAALSATSKDGEIYAVPALTDYTNDYAWICRESYLTEAGFTKDDVKDLDDITRVFKAVKALHPEMKLLSGGAQSLGVGGGLQLDGTSYDYLGTDVLGVMLDRDAEHVVCYQETEEFQHMMHILQGWYAAGYIDQDIATRSTDPTSDTSVFSFILGGNDARTAGSEALAGEPLVSIKLTNGYVTTSTIAIMNMAIPSSATEPEAAAKLMNLCYTDRELKMLVSYGFEGVNYTYAENGGIKVDTGSNYAPNTVAIFGNALLCDPTEQDVNMGYNAADVDINTLRFSPLVGFNIDTSNISAEAAAISSVYNEYKGQVCTGVGSDATYEEFINKLYANGLQKYIDEVQSQLDAWRAEN